MSTIVRTSRPGKASCLARLKQSGFGLVELMVSITIGLLILAAMVAVFVNTSGSNRELARANSVIENGRLAIQLIESDVVHAGFWGSHVPQFDDLTFTTAPTDVPTAVPDPCLAYTTPWTPQDRTNLVGIVVQTYDAAAVCAGVILDQQPNTDILIVRHAETCVPGTVIGAGNCEADNAAKLYVQDSRCFSDTVPFVFGDTGFALLQRDCTTLAEKRKFVSTIYYVRTYAVTPGDGIPTLMRSQFDLVGGVPAHQPAVPMIEGIQSFTVELGIDNVSKTGVTVNAASYLVPVNWQNTATKTTPTNRGDGSPDGNFIRCTTSTPCNDPVQLANVTAVRAYVLVRSRETSPGYTDSKTYTLAGGTTLGPFNDNFKRHLFVTTMRLPNVSGRRETP